MMACKTDIKDFTYYDEILLGMDFERIYDEYPGGGGGGGVAPHRRGAPPPRGGVVFS